MRRDAIFFAIVLILLAVFLGFAVHPLFFFLIVFLFLLIFV